LSADGFLWQSSVDEAREHVAHAKFDLWHVIAKKVAIADRNCDISVAWNCLDL